VIRFTKVLLPFSIKTTDTSYVETITSLVQRMAQTKAN
jgi:hypothetical protein